MIKKIPWGITATCIFALLVWVIIPDTDTRSRIVTVTKHIKPEEFVTLQTVAQEIEQINREIGANWGKYSGAMAYQHMNRLIYLEKHLPVIEDYYDPELVRLSFRLGQVKMLSANARREQPNYNQVSLDFVKLRDSDKNCWFDYKPTTETYNFKILLEYWSGIYPFTACFAFLFFICLLMRRDLFFLELKRFFVFRLIFFSLFWPVSIWYYPSKDFACQVRVTLHWLRCFLSLAISALMPAMAKAQQKRNFSGNVHVFSDTRHDRQLFVSLVRGNLLVLNQNRTTIDGKAKFSYVGLGAKFKAKNNLSFSAIFGPQWTYEKKGVDRTVLFANATIGNSLNSITSINRLSFGHKPKTPFSNRHIQNLKHKYLPSWLSLEGEELHSSGKWRELFFGPMVKIKKFYFYPFWDGARGNFDVRLGYVHNF